MLYVNIIPLQQSFVLHSSSDPVTLSSRLVLFFFFFLSVGGGGEWYQPDLRIVVFIYISALQLWQSTFLSSQCLEAASLGSSK